MEYDNIEKETMVNIITLIETELNKQNSIRIYSLLKELLRVYTLFDDFHKLEEC